MRVQRRVFISVSCKIVENFEEMVTDGNMENSQEALEKTQRRSWLMHKIGLSFKKWRISRVVRGMQ